MSWKNIRLIFLRELRDQLRDRRTLFMITILPLLLYPMLGLGVVEMLLTFSEQQRVVVVLNADELPQTPPLLDEQGIQEGWFEGGKQDTSRLRVLAERETASNITEAAGSQSGDTQNTPTERRLRRGEKTDTELLQAAHRLAEQIQKLCRLQSESQSAATANSDSANQSTADPAPAVKHAEQISELQDHISQQFGESGFQVLVMIPKGYATAIEAMQNQIQERSSSPAVPGHATARVPPVLVIRNSADDKSVAAFGRVQRALDRWEDAVRENSFVKAALPLELQHPARLAWIEVAREEEVAASVWSRLFPALLVIMALTGAFYPAIDLGAGEKERGTMETLLICPAKRIELVLGKFLTIMLFSIATAILNLLSMGLTGQQMAAVVGAGMADSVSLEFPGFQALMWLGILLLPLAALFSALCLALATFARSTKEGQYYLTPLLMVVMGMTMFCLLPGVEMTPLYSVIPVVNVALLLKGLLLNAPGSGDLIAYTVPVLISSIGYSMLALWWAIELYSSEDVLFREAEKFDVRLWLRHIFRTKDAVPAFPEAVACFILILMLQFGAMTYMKPDLSSGDPGHAMFRLTVIQQLVTIACPAVFMSILLTTSLRATLRLRMPALSAVAIGIGLAVVAHPLSIELAHFFAGHQVFPEPPESIRRALSLLKTGEQPTWLVLLVFAVTPAICEELAFRGFILSGLARGGRLAIAVGISSLMFGFIHMIPQQAFNAALLGLVLGLLAIYSRSLLPAIAFHFCNNALAVFHAGEGRQIVADGTFLTRIDGELRYQLPLLVFCSVAGTLTVLHMIRVVVREQDQKRRGLIPAFGECRHQALGIGIPVTPLA